MTGSVGAVTLFNGVKCTE